MSVREDMCEAISWLLKLKRLLGGRIESVDVAKIDSGHGVRDGPAARGHDGDCPGQVATVLVRWVHQIALPLKRKGQHLRMLASSGVRVRKFTSEALGFCTPGTPERTADLHHRPT